MMPRIADVLVAVLVMIVQIAVEPLPAARPLDRKKVRRAAPLVSDQQRAEIAAWNTAVQAKKAAKNERKVRR